MPTVELRFAALPAHVRTARLIAASLARRTGVDEALIDEVKLAVGEACARAVSLHQEHAADQQVVVEINDDEGRLVIAVTDRGPADADTAVAVTGEAVADVPDLLDVTDLEGDPAAAMPAGFGLAVIAGLVDHVEVVPGEPGTVVRMTWTPGGAA